MRYERLAREWCFGHGVEFEATIAMHQKMEADGADPNAADGLAVYTHSVSRQPVGDDGP